MKLVRTQTTPIMGTNVVRCEKCSQLNFDLRTGECSEESCTEEES